MHKLLELNKIGQSPDFEPVPGLVRCAHIFQSIISDCQQFRTVFFIHVPVFATFRFRSKRTCGFFPAYFKNYLKPMIVFFAEGGKVFRRSIDITDRLLNAYIYVERAREYKLEFGKQPDGTFHNFRA